MFNHCSTLCAAWAAADGRRVSWLIFRLSAPEGDTGKAFWEFSIQLEKIERLLCVSILNSVREANSPRWCEPLLKISQSHWWQYASPSLQAELSLQRRISWSTPKGKERGRIVVCLGQSDLHPEPSFWCTWENCIFYILKTQTFKKYTTCWVLGTLCLCLCLGLTNNNIIIVSVLRALWSAAILFIIRECTG